MLIGYIRENLGGNETHLELQRTALIEFGVNKKFIFEDRCISRNNPTVGFYEALSFMKRDDVLVIYKLDRLCRNLKHLLNTLYDFNKQGFHIKSISEPYIDSQNNTEYFSFVDTFYKYEFLLTKERLNSKFETKKVKKLKIDSLTYKEVLEAVKNNYPKKTIQSMFNISSSQLTNIIKAQEEKTAIII